MSAWFVPQGFENFKKEFEQLRRAFRYDEFETVTNASPPGNPVTKVLPPVYCSVWRFCRHLVVAATSPAPDLQTRCCVSVGVCTVVQRGHHAGEQQGRLAACA